MKLREAVSWLMGTLQRNLIPGLEACGEPPLTEKEQQLIGILELVYIEIFAGRPSQKIGRKRRERQALARS
jgi:hypothetical protein